MTKRQKLESLPKFSDTHKVPSDKHVVKYLTEENKPYNILKDRLQPFKKLETKGVVHIFDHDIRSQDNRGLYEATQIGKKVKAPVYGLYVHCTEDLYNHAVSAFQLTYKIDALNHLKSDLEKLKIPLTILEVEKSKDVDKEIINWCKEREIDYITTNMVYEVNELRLVTRLCDKFDGHVSAYQDNCIVPPGELKSGKGTQYSIFTPWYRSWAKYVNANGIETYEPEANGKLPEKSNVSFKVPDDKKLSTEHKKTYDKLYKSMSSYDGAMKRFHDYADNMEDYDENRNNLTYNASHLSAPLAIGVISSRTIIRYLLDNKIKKVDQGDDGTVQWVRQIAWRDFYKHIVANCPFVCMHKPFQLDYSDIEWEYNKEHWLAWCEGNTGFPVVDACMRQLNTTGYLSNRGRMIVASFLTKHLMIDWRYGEEYFLNHLVDCDFASNNGGWGFCSSVGVDPQPYFRIFNPYLQSTRFDSDGEFIKQWVPELKSLDTKKIHHPDEIENYPEPIVDHKTARERALERYADAR